MGFADLHLLDQIAAIYLGCQFLLIAGFSAWFTVNIEKILTANGSLDLYLNYYFRLLPMALGLYLIWAAIDALVSRLVSL